MRFARVFRIALFRISLFRIALCLAAAAAAACGRDAGEGSPPGIAAPAATVAPPAASPAGAGWADGLLAAVNAERAKAGLGALRREDRLDCAARVQAADNARRGVLDHAGGDGSGLADRLARVGYPFRAAAENLALAGAEPDAALRLWRASDGHRRNLLLQDGAQAGIARHRSGRQWVWALVIAAEMPQNRENARTLRQFTCESR